jgi:haloalkane dehalogenase
VVFLHGNPTSARLYRHLLPSLQPTYRCVAPDYLGFGRSAAPPNFSYRPPAHATLVERLLRHLDLTDITLVLHDWGGPIGLSYALRHPTTVRRLVLMNTWMWPLLDRPLVRLFGRFVNTPLGRYLVERHNLFARAVMPWTTGPASSSDWIAPYADALSTRTRRRACCTFARSLTAETPWLRSLWSDRHRLPAVPTLLCWGMADPAFGTEACLRRWQSLVPAAHIHRWADVGHYVPEERGDTLGPLLRRFLDS